MLAVVTYNSIAHETCAIKLAYQLIRILYLEVVDKFELSNALVILFGQVESCVNCKDVERIIFFSFGNK